MTEWEVLEMGTQCSLVAGNNQVLPYPMVVQTVVKRTTLLGYHIRNSQQTVLVVKGQVDHMILMMHIEGAHFLEEGDSQMDLPSAA